MKKKIYIAMIFFVVLFSAFLTQKSFAKYTMSGMLQMKVYIDKTPPVIDITSNGSKESFPTSISEVVKRTDEVTINTSDNIKIQYNEYYYNASNNNFDEVSGTRFDNGKTLTEEGYYKVVSVDTSGNKTEIIILLDKSAPDVMVRYFKKGEETAQLNSSRFRQVAGIQKNMTTRNITDTRKEKTKEVKQDTEKQKDFEINMMSEDIMLLSGDWYVGNESEFRNALANYADVIHVRQSIDFGSPIVVNYPLTIVRESDSNSLRYGNGGSFIIVQAGGMLILDGMVVDTNSSGNGGMTAINIENGGAVTFVNSSIVDRTD